MLSIRPASGEDVDAIAVLCRQLGYASTSQEIRERLGTMADSRDCAVIVGEVDEVVAAFVQVSVRRAIESGEWAEIDALVVDDARRGQGFGALMVKHVRLWARARGLARVRVRTNVSRLRTHTFYEREGFTLSKSQRVYDVSA
jgi:GNAT superfamily N-acetyltransferase